jgi:hypothetical protein
MGCFKLNPTYYIPSLICILSGIFAGETDLSVRILLIKAHCAYRRVLGFTETGGGTTGRECTCWHSCGVVLYNKQ